MDAAIHLFETLPRREGLFAATSILYRQGSALYDIEGIPWVIVPAERSVRVYRKCSHRHGGRPLEKLRVRNGAKRKYVCRLRIDDGCANKYAQAHCDYRCYLEFSDFHVSLRFSSMMLVAFTAGPRTPVYLAANCSGRAARSRMRLPNCCYPCPTY